MKKEIRVYLEDVFESVGKIEEYTKGVVLEEFKSNTECQDAVMRRLEIIGEAVKNLPNDLKEKYPGTPWKQIAGMRDILIHEYAGVSLERVWKVIINDLQPLKNAVSRILSDL